MRVKEGCYVGNVCQDGGGGFWFCAKMCISPERRYKLNVIFTLHNYLLIRQLRQKKPKWGSIDFKLVYFLHICYKYWALGGDYFEFLRQNKKGSNYGS